MAELADAADSKSLYGGLSGNAGQRSVLQKGSLGGLDFPKHCAELHENALCSQRECHQYCHQSMVWRLHIASTSVGATEALPAVSHVYGFPLCQPSLLRSHNVYFAFEIRLLAQITLTIVVKKSSLTVLVTIEQHSLTRRRQYMAHGRNQQKFEELDFVGQSRSINGSTRHMERAITANVGRAAVEGRDVDAVLAVRINTVQQMLDRLRARL
jgi:hypothetical protein